MKLYIQIMKRNFQRLGVQAGSKILDAGCGNGDVVQLLRNENFKTCGIDIEFKDGDEVDKLVALGVIRKIQVGSRSRKTLHSGDTYEWPEFDEKFDGIVSRAVIEHVRNIDEFVCNSREALEDHGGICLHYYPSRWSIVEPHTGVFFGAVLQNLSYYKAMCRLKLCFKKYQGQGDLAFRYMTQFTSYRSQREIDMAFARGGFTRIKTLQVLECHSNKWVRALSILPFVNFLFRTFRSVVVGYRIREN